MPRNLFTALFSVSLIFSAGVSFARSDFDGRSPAKGALVSPAPGAPAVPSAGGVLVSQAMAEWTVMVYVNGKNNLESAAIKDLNEMEMVGSTGRIQVVVELGRMSGYNSSNGDWTGARRYLITQDSDTSTITSPELQVINNVDMGDWKHLVDFGRWAKANYPARHYLLIVWNHGDGWKKGRADNKGISYDSETGNHINTPQLAEALREMGKVDVYASDACLMQMVEVAYQLKDCADYIAGSEETEPGDGYTYDAFLQLANNSDMTPLSVGKALVETYINHYAALGRSATHSLLQTAALASVPPALNDWVDVVLAEGRIDDVNNARIYGTSFRIYDNRDIFNFIRLIKQSGSLNIQAKSSVLLRALSAVVAANKVSGREYSEAEGLAAYIPGYSYDQNYDEIAFARDTKWPALIKWIVGRETPWSHSTGSPRTKGGR